jgi:hypothetical protein
MIFIFSHYWQFLVFHEPSLQPSSLFLDKLPERVRVSTLVTTRRKHKDFGEEVELALQALVDHVRVAAAAAERSR